MLEIPIRTTSTNAKLRVHWAVLRRRAKAEREAVALAWRSEFRRRAGIRLPLAVQLTRVSPRPLDDDNLRGALKAVRDQVAAELGVDDRDPRVEWLYAQQRGEPKTYAVRVELLAHSSRRGCSSCAAASLEHEERCECRCHARNRESS